MLAMWYDIIPPLGAGAMVVVAFLGWWSAREKDKATREAVTEAAPLDRVTKAVDILESVITALQEDRKDLRADLALEREINRLRIAKDLANEAKGHLVEIENGKIGD